MDVNLYLKKELFYCSFEFNRKIDAEFLNQLFFIFTNNYTNVEFGLDLNDNDTIYSNKLPIEKILDEVKDKIIRILVSNSFYYQCDHKLASKLVNNGFDLRLGKSISTEGNYLLLNLHVNAFTNYIYIFDGSGWRKEDITQAAMLNRKNLASLIIDLETLVRADGHESRSDYHLMPNSVYKHGIKEDAQMIIPGI